MKIQQTSPNRPRGWISRILQATVAIATAVPIMASASFIASDNFDSYDGVNPIVGQSVASNNWATGWFYGNGSAPAVSSTTTLIYTPPGGSPVGGGNTVLVGNGTGHPAIRQIYAPITNTFYAAVLTKWNAGTLNSGDGSFVCLTDSESNTNNGVIFGINGPVATGITIRKGVAGTAVSKSMATATTYYLVLKVEKTGAGNYDKVTCWINPTTQSERFDPDGDYIRHWVPELAGLGSAAIHSPGFERPETYPPPMVDHAAERAEALARYKSVTSSSR